MSLSKMQNCCSSKCFLLITLLVLVVSLCFHTASCLESGSTDLQISSLNVIVYDLDVERKEVDLQCYFSFDANSSFETRVIFIPKTQPTYVYYGQNTSGDWHHCVIDLGRIHYDVSSPDQFLYPFDTYIVKILIGLNVTIETKRLMGELSKAEFEIEKDTERSVETYWDISNDTEVVSNIPQEYAKFLNDANKTVFQLGIALSRKFNQRIVPLFSNWVAPILACAPPTGVFWFIKKEREFKFIVASVAVIVGPATLLMSMLFWMQSQKPPSSVTLGEILIMAAFVWVIALALNGLRLIRKEKAREQQSQIAVAFPIESRFDPDKFATDVRNFTNLRDEDTRYKLLEGIRNQATCLPLDGMPPALRNMVINFLLILEGEMSNEKMRLLCMRCVSAIYHRRDPVVNDRVRTIFTGKMWRIFENLTMEEKAKALSLEQELREHDFEFMKELLTAALNWETTEFETLYTSIEFGNLTKKQVSTLRKTLWEWRADATQRGQAEKVSRIDRLLDLGEFH